MLNTRSIALTLALLGSSSVFAQCFQPSPNLTAMGKDYYRQMQLYQWSSKELKQKEALLEAAEDDWEGDYSETECMGTDKNPREEKKSATVKADIQLVMKGTLKISAQKKFASSGTTKSSSDQLFDDRHVFSGSVSKNRLQTTEIHSAKVGYSGRRMDEIMTTLDIEGDQLTLIRTIYYNGYLGRIERYTLTRD